MDEERLQAEQQLRQLRMRLADSEEMDDPCGLSDEALRGELARLRLRLRFADHRVCTSARRAALEAIAQRLLGSHLVVDVDVVAERLESEYGLRVADDGLVECDRLDGRVQALVGDLPVALYHATSTALASAIAADGLRIGRATNFFNTQAGVYLSVKSGSAAMDLYGRTASAVHGGEPMVVRVRRRVDQLRADPDDADLAPACDVQFVSEPVPVEDLLGPDLADLDRGCRMRGA